MSLYGGLICFLFRPSNKRIWRGMWALQASQTKCTGSLSRGALSSLSWSWVRTQAFLQHCNVLAFRCRLCESTGVWLWFVTFKVIRGRVSLSLSLSLTLSLCEKENAGQTTRVSLMAGGGHITEAFLCIHHLSVTTALDPFPPEQKHLTWHRSAYCKEKHSCGMLGYGGAKSGPRTSPLLIRPCLEGKSFRGSKPFPVAGPIEPAAKNSPLPLPASSELFGVLCCLFPLQAWLAHSSTVIQ